MWHRGSIACLVFRRGKLNWMLEGFSCIKVCLLRRVRTIPHKQQESFGTRPSRDSIKALFVVWSFALSGCSSHLGQASPDHSDGPQARSKIPINRRLAAGGYQKPCVVPPTDNDIEDSEVAERQSAVVNEHPAPPPEPPTSPPENRYRTGTVLSSDVPPF